MADDPNARRDFISRIGTFFVVIGMFLVIIFIASDISRNNPGRIANVTQTYVFEAAQAVATRDAESTLIAPQGLPTPTLVPSGQQSQDVFLSYIPVFCFGAIALLLGWFFKRISAVPSKPSNRFEGIRKFQQKQREAKAAREAKKKEKEKEKKK